MERVIDDGRIPIKDAVLEVLDKASKRIDEYGWIQGDMKNDDGYCTYGAIVAEAAELEPNPILKLLLVEITTNTMSKFLGDRIAYWNDHIAESDLQVILSLKSCANEIKQGTVKLQKSTIKV